MKTGKQSAPATAGAINRGEPEKLPKVTTEGTEDQDGLTPAERAANRWNAEIRRIWAYKEALDRQAETGGIEATLDLLELNAKEESR